MATTGQHERSAPARTGPYGQAVELAVEVSAILYRAPDGEFAVVEATGETGEEVVLTGPIAYLHEGERLQVAGRWQEHPRHGMRLRVMQARHAEPTSSAGLLAALGAVKHVGPRGAAFLYERYGDKTLAVIDRAPRRRLLEIPGIGRARIGEAVRSWEEQRAQRALRMFLASHGLDAAVAARIFRAWGTRSVEQLRTDPYALTAIAGVGFQTADALARALGTAPDAPERIEAGIGHTLAQAELDGHCCLPRAALEERAAALLGLEVAERIDELCAAGRLVAEEADHEHGPLIYAAEMHALERRLGERVRELVGAAPTLERDEEPHASPGGVRDGGGTRTAGDRRTRAGRAPASTGDPGGRRRAAFAPTAEQRLAVRRALGHRLSILTGGPGTGKTTSMRLLVEALARQGAGACLCAPTGKAARRLAAATGEEASTIHRLLEWQPGRGFARGREHPLEGFELLIVDEASMLGVRLAEALFAAVGPEMHVLLVGDSDQLAPIGPGRVLEDLIASTAVPTTALSEIFRQARRSLIVRAAHAINEGRPPLPTAGSGEGSGAEAPGDARAAQERRAAEPRVARRPAEEAPAEEAPIRDFFLITRASEEEVFAEVVSLASERLPAHFSLDPKLDVQVLAPMRRGRVGIEALGGELRTRLNPGGEPLPGSSLRVGDRVIQTRNDYEHDFMNGEVALVQAWDRERERVRLRTDDGRTLVLPPNALDSVEPGYAISIHKAQGSQAPAVVIALARSHRIMLTRNLLYTGVTRAERVCVIVCQPGALELALGRRDARRRYTRLAEMVQAPRPASVPPQTHGREYAEHENPPGDATSVQ
jgi:exodeoxyribonuclease V alpha subunit